MLKAKETKKMVYKRGLAVELRGVEQSAGEYHGEEEKLSLILHFNSKNAINNASKILGYKLGKEKKDLISNFERGHKRHSVYLDSQDVWALNCYFGFKFHIGQYGYSFSYNNHYSGSVIYETVNPKNIFSVDKDSLDRYLGTVADGDCTFKEYLESVIARINKDYYIYCPQVL